MAKSKISCSLLSITFTFISILPRVLSIPASTETVPSSPETTPSSELNTTTTKTTGGSADSGMTVCGESYTPHSDDARTCIPGFMCLYGVCDRAAFIGCICDPGVTGLLCDTECCLDCGDHGKCVYDNINNMEFCNCFSGYSGERCDQIRQDDTTTTTESSSSSDDTTEPCTSGCCLDCGDHGTCTFDVLAMSDTCYCDPNYTGEICEHQIQSTSPPPTGPKCSLDCDPGYECKSIGAMAACQPIATATTPSGLIDIDTSPQDLGRVCGEDRELRSLSERMCPGGLMCIWGVCVPDGNGMHCECDDGAHGVTCENECCKQCGTNGTCFYDVMTQSELCNCFGGFTGDVCENIKTTPAAIIRTDDDRFILIVGVCVGMIVLLIVIFAVILYVMWRHRVILVMKIVHYFQGYEDDDDREWDAFISYKSDPRDEEFVVKVLFPTLEKEMGFKTHVHFRDFIPGDTIANNIIRAVQGSRRTILIISPNFVKSDFTRFEYQVAQQEMLKQKHRIIPILLDDITDHKDTIDPNLKVILGSVTYLEWPEDETEKKISKFWKRLQLSLPKKRVKPDTDIAERQNSTKERNLYLTSDKNEVKNNNVFINVPDDTNDGGYDKIEDVDILYDKIDDSKLDKSPNSITNRQVNEYVDILECTRM